MKFAYESERGVDRRYARIDPAQIASLQDFRQRYRPGQLTVNNVSWEYLALGKGDQTILFLSGLAGSYDIWWQQMTALQDRYRVISATYPVVSGLREMARGLLAILDREGVERVTVVGSSLGGYLAQYLLAVLPERLERVVLGNTYANCELIKQKFGLACSLLPYTPERLVMAILRAGYRSLIYPTSRFSNVLLNYLNELTYRTVSKAQIHARYHAAVEPFTLTDPSTLNIPLLILESDNDPVIEPLVRENMRLTYSTASVHTFHNAGHFPYLVVPEEYLKVLEEFLEGNGRKGDKG